MSVVSEVSFCASQVKKNGLAQTIAYFGCETGVGKSVQSCRSANGGELLVWLQQLYVCLWSGISLGRFLILPCSFAMTCYVL